MMNTDKIIFNHINKCHQRSEYISYTILIIILKVLLIDIYIGQKKYFTISDPLKIE